MLLPDAVATRLPPPVHTGGQVRAATRAVLSRSEFYERPKSLLARARDAVIDKLGRLLARLLEGAHGSVIGWVVVVAVVAVLVYLAARFVRGIRTDPELAAAVAVVPRRSAAEWRAEAGALEQRGDWRGAMRCRYRALVADLAARGLVEEVPGRTTGEYRTEVRVAAPVVAGDFSGATELFERAWYGNLATGADESRRFRELSDRVLTEVAS